MPTPRPTITIELFTRDEVSRLAAYAAAIFIPTVIALIFLEVPFSLGALAHTIFLSAAGGYIMVMIDRVSASLAKRKG